MRKCLRLFLVPLIIVLGLSLIAAACDQPVGPQGTFQVVFEDNFNGTQLDTTKWSHGWLGGSNPVQNQEIACYSPNNVKVYDGMLHLIATKTPSNCSKGTNPHPYTSGAVGTGYGVNKKTFSLGYFEARIYLEGNGTKLYNWPAWWLDGTGQWPTTGELDVMEGLSGTASAHWHDTSGGYNFGRFGYTPGWHIYGADWQVGKVTSYLDGKRIGEYVGSGVKTDPQFLNLMNQVSPENKYGGPPAPTDMRVDYVKIWKRL